MGFGPVADVQRKNDLRLGVRTPWAYPTRETADGVPIYLACRRSLAGTARPATDWERDRIPAPSISTSPRCKATAWGRFSVENSPSRKPWLTFRHVVRKATVVA